MRWYLLITYALQCRSEKNGTCFVSPSLSQASMPLILCNHQKCLGLHTSLIELQHGMMTLTQLSVRTDERFDADSGPCRKAFQDGRCTQDVGNPVEGERKTKKNRRYKKKRKKERTKPRIRDRAGTHTHT